MLLFSQSLIRTHHTDTLKTEFINRKYRSLPDFVLVLKINLLILQVKQVCYVATDYQLSNEMSDQTAHSNFIITFICTSRWI